MAKPIDAMKADYMTTEEITIKLRTDGLEDYLRFERNGDYDYLECEHCDGPMLGHQIAKCRYNEGYDEKTIRRFKKWLDRIPELRRLLEARAITTEGTSTDYATIDNRNEIDEWINQLQSEEDRRSESRSGYSRTTSRERDRRDSSQFSRRISSRSTSRTDQDENRSRRNESLAGGTKEGERLANESESDLGERVEGLKKEIEEIKKSIGGISRIEEMLKNAMISAQDKEDEIFIDAPETLLEKAGDEGKVERNLTVVTGKSSETRYTSKMDKNRRLAHRRRRHPQDG